MRPPYRKARAPLTPSQVGELVVMRDGGASWKDVGRAFRLQDGDAKAIYDRAVAQRPPVGGISATGGHMDVGPVGE